MPSRRFGDRSKSSSRLVNSTDAAAFEQTIGPRLDLAAFVRYIAAQNFIAENDGFNGYDGMNNFYIYRLENSTEPRVHLVGRGQRVSAAGLRHHDPHRRERADSQDALAAWLSDRSTSACSRKRRASAAGWMRQEMQRQLDMINDGDARRHAEAVLERRIPSRIGTRCWRFRTRALLTSAARSRSRPARPVLPVASKRLRDLAETPASEVEEAFASAPPRAPHHATARRLRDALRRSRFQHQRAVFRITAIGAPLPRPIDLALFGRARARRRSARIASTGAASPRSSRRRRRTLWRFRHTAPRPRRRRLRAPGESPSAVEMPGPPRRHSDKVRIEMLRSPRPAAASSPNRPGRIPAADRALDAGMLAALRRSRHARPRPRPCRASRRWRSGALDI